MRIILSDNAYNALKWITLIALPALATLYFALSEIWPLPYGEEVVGTIAALTTFLGIILGVSTAQYNAARQNGQSEEEARSTRR